MQNYKKNPETVQTISEFFIINMEQENCSTLITRE